MKNLLLFLVISFICFSCYSLKPKKDKGTPTNFEVEIEYVDLKNKPHKDTLIVPGFRYNRERTYSLLGPTLINNTIYLYPGDKVGSIYGVESFKIIRIIKEEKDSEKPNVKKIFKLKK